jgi:hypothetical protein
MVSVRRRFLSHSTWQSTGALRAFRFGMQRIISRSIKALRNQSACSGSLEPVAFTVAVPTVGEQRPGRRQ